MYAKASSQPERVLRLASSTSLPSSTRISSVSPKLQSLMTEAGMRMPLELPMEMSAAFMMNHSMAR